MQASQDGLPTILRESLPLRQKLSAYMLLLLGGKVSPTFLAVADSLPLFRGQAVPLLSASANLRLALRRQVLEPLVVIQEAFLRLRRHIAQPLHPVWRHALHFAQFVLSPFLRLGARNRIAALAVGAWMVVSVTLSAPGTWLRHGRQDYEQGHEEARERANWSRNPRITYPCSRPMAALEAPKAPQNWPAH